MQMRNQKHIHPATAFSYAAVRMSALCVEVQIVTWLDLDDLVGSPTARYFTQIALAASDLLEYGCRNDVEK